MKTYKITLASIKNLKAAFDFADNFREDNSFAQGYAIISNSEALIEDYDTKANREAQVIAEVLNIPVSNVIDMAFDFDFAERVLSDISKKAA